MNSRKIKSISTLLMLTLFRVPTARALETFFEEESTLPRVQVALVVRGGSVDDPAGKEGLTQFLGELLLRGTKTRSREALNEAIDQLGAEIGAETRQEALILRGAVLSRNLETFLGIFRDVVLNPAFNPVEIKKLKQEVISALLEETGRDTALSMRDFNHLLFGNHPYSRSPLGRIKQVQSFTEADLRAHYLRLFAQNRLLLIGLGDAKESAMSNWGSNLVTTMPAESKLPELKAPTAPAKTVLQIVDKPNRTQTQIEIGQIGVTALDPDYFALHIGNHAFGGRSFQARLMVEIRVKRGWSYGAYSQFRQGVVPKSWQIHLFPASKDAAPALRKTLEMVGALQTDGITDSEFKFAQDSLINGAGFAYNTSKKRMENRIVEKLLGLPDGFVMNQASHLQKVKREQVNAALKKFLKPDALAISVLATASELKAPLTKAAGVKSEEVKVVPFNAE